MKLFGDTGKRERAAAVPKKGTTAAEKPNKMPLAWLNAPIWRRLRLPLIIVGSLILLLLLGLLVYSIWEKPPETPDNGPIVQPTVKPAVSTPVPETPGPVLPEETDTPEETPQPEATEQPTGRKENCYTFVVLAYDQFKANTDTILVGRMDTDAGTLDLVNIPRDTLVNVSWGVKKLNTVLASERNEVERFLPHLGNLIGFTPDCYAIVDIKVVQKLVDCIGGVYYNVPRDMDYDDPTQDLSIHIPQGYQLLNGENAVKVLRFRMGNDNTGYANGDLGRIATQQDFLLCMAGQFLTLGNIPNLDNAIEIFRENVRTDLTASNIAFFVREFLQMDKENIRFHTLPGTGISIRGGSYLEVDIDEWVGIVNDYLNPYHRIITADNLNILQANKLGGATSTSGDELPVTSFYDFSEYVG